MQVKKVSFPMELNRIEDINDDNIDVFVELEDQTKYSVCVVTVKNILTLMAKTNKNFLEPGCPFIIVDQLREDTIVEAIKSYAEGDAYWLKIHHLSAEFDTKMLDGMLVKSQ